jgi:transcriptional regulator with XRE-family HTH domain
MSIGERIKAARKAAGMSQEAVARKAGLSLKGMGAIERGWIEDPHLNSLRRIAEALDVPLITLLEEPVLAGKAEAPGGGGRGADVLPHDLFQLERDIERLLAGEDGAERAVKASLAKLRHDVADLDEQREASRERTTLLHHYDVDAKDETA